MLSVVIALLTVAAMAGGVLTLRQMRRNREVNVVSVPSGPAVPLPQGANRWRSSPEGGLR
jgi:hypothetical protein